VVTVLKKFWQGIAEYADAVIALVLAIVFGLLGAFGIVSQTVTSGGILTTLAVLAIVILRDRVNKVSLDRDVRDATNESREVLGKLPNRLSRIDELAGSVHELRGLIEGTATVRTLRGAEVQAAHKDARWRTDRWYFRGGTGTYTRAVTLPQCVDDARRDRRALQFRIEIIDPTDAEACKRYEDFRRSVYPGPDGTGETWYPGRARLESYATIVAACWNMQRFQLLDIQVGLSSVMSTFRYDMSSEYLIITQDDPRNPAHLVPRRKSLYDAYGVELRTSFEQARRVRLEFANRVPLSTEPTAQEVETLLEALELSPKPPLEQAEAEVIAQKAIHAKDPYPDQA
jgi:hypothetical protein